MKAWLAFAVLSSLAAVLMVFLGKEGMLELGVQMRRVYRSALQPHLCLILVSILLMGKVSLWSQEEMVQFHTAGRWRCWPRACIQTSGHVLADSYAPS